MRAEGIVVEHSKKENAKLAFSESHFLGHQPEGIVSVSPSLFYPPTLAVAPSIPCSSCLLGKNVILLVSVLRTFLLLGFTDSFSKLHCHKPLRGGQNVLLHRYTFVFKIFLLLRILKKKRRKHKGDVLKKPE